MIYFTADQHLGHANIIKYCQRPFHSIEQMDKTILDNTFDTLKKGDTLYCLGDLTFRDTIAQEFLRKLIQIGVGLVYLRGNHDSKIMRVFYPLKIPVDSLKTCNFDNQVVVLCHFAMRIWDRSHYGSWHLYGHSHGTLPPLGKSYDVGVDNNNFAPVSWEQIKVIMQDLDDNPNLIK